MVVSCLVVMRVQSEVGVVVPIKVQELRLLLLEEARLGTTTTKGVVTLRGERIFVVLRGHDHSIGSLLPHVRTIGATMASAIHEDCLILHQTRLVAWPNWLVTSVLGWAHVIRMLLFLRSTVRVQSTEHWAYVSAAHVSRIHHAVGMWASNTHRI